MMKASSFLSAGILVIDAGLAPENFSGSLRSFKPNIILLMDAADMAEPPGCLAALDWQSAGGFGASTHLQPLSTFGEYLSIELGCDLVLLGIQPAHNQFDRPVSPPVKAAVERLVEDLYGLLVGN
jgi:hydrogenase 3 maturation protease